MTLRVKTSLILLAGMTLSAGLNYGIQRWVLQPTFASLEQEEARKDLKRCLEALHREISYVDTFIADWAAWDDTYRFVEDRNPDYISSNLGYSSFENAAVNLIYICNRKGEVVWGRIYDLDTAKEVELEEFPKKSWSPDHPLLARSDPWESVSGIVLTKRGPIIVASGPIVTSANEGPIRGTLMMGRFIQDKMVQRLVEQTHVHFRIWPIRNGGLGPKERAALGQLTQLGSIWVHEEEPRRLHLYAMFPDILGQPALLIRAEVPRDITAHSAKSIHYMLVLMGAVGLASLFAVLGLLQAVVVYPVACLTSHVTSITRSQDLSRRLAMARGDEIGTLASKFDGMLDRIDRDFKERLRAEQALAESVSLLQATFDATAEGILAVTRDGKVVTCNNRLAQMWRIPKTALNTQPGPNALDLDITQLVDPQVFLSRIQESFADPDIETNDMLFFKDGRVVELYSRPQKLAGKTVGRVWIFKDVTQHAQAEAGLARAHAHELAVRRRIQETLLLGAVPEYVTGLDVGVITLPSEAVDGDFYDFFGHSPHCLDMVVGDIMGKGTTAALLGAATKSQLLRALNRLMSMTPGVIPEPEAIVNFVHTEVTPQFGRPEIGLFVTLCYTRFDLDKRLVVLVDCGHPKPIHYQKRQDRCVTLEGPNMPLGISEEEVYRQVSAPFEQGDMFFFYSDGVTEARNVGGEFFGAERVAECVRRYSVLPPQQLIEKVVEDVKAFGGTDRFHDDLTCVAVKIEEDTAGGFRLRRELTIWSDLGELTRVRRFVRQFCEDLPPPGMDEESHAKVELALAEAVTNVMRHGLKGRAGEPILIECSASEERICVNLCHWGEPFQPDRITLPDLERSSEGGLGLYIIERCMDEVVYSQDTAGKNCISLVKHVRQPRGERSDGTENRKGE